MEFYNIVPGPRPGAVPINPVGPGMGYVRNYAAVETARASPYGRDAYISDEPGAPPVVFEAGYEPWPTVPSPEELAARARAEAQAKDEALAAACVLLLR